MKFNLDQRAYKDLLECTTQFCYCALAIGTVWPLVGIIAASLWIVMTIVANCCYKQSPHSRDLWANIVNVLNFLIYGGALAAMITWITMMPEAVNHNP